MEKIKWQNHGDCVQIATNYKLSYHQQQIAVGTICMVATMSCGYFIDGNVPCN